MCFEISFLMIKSSVYFVFIKFSYRNLSWFIKFRLNPYYYSLDSVSTFMTCSSNFSTSSAINFWLECSSFAKKPTETNTKTKLKRNKWLKFFFPVVTELYWSLVVSWKIESITVLKRSSQMKYIGTFDILVDTFEELENCLREFLQTRFFFEALGRERGVGVAFYIFGHSDFLGYTKLNTKRITTCRFYLVYLAYFTFHLYQKASLFLFYVFAWDCSLQAFICCSYLNIWHWTKIHLLLKRLPSVLQGIF